MPKKFIFGFLFLFSQLSMAINLSYVDTGNPKGVPVIFIHAFPLNKSMWDDQIAALRNTARVITFDIRGLGKSELDGPYTLEFVVDDLINLMDRLKIDKAVLCGLSMGGFVALRAIEREPARFKGLILADTKSEPDSDKSKLGRYQALKTIREKGVKNFSESFIQVAIAPTIPTEKPQIFNRIKKIAEVNNTDGVSAALMALTSRTDTTPGLAEIHVPTLILQGEFDSVIPLESAKAMNEKIKGSQFFIIPKAGHLSNLENPQAFNARLTLFLTELKTGVKAPSL